MISFHGDRKIKAKYLKRVRAHMKADNLIRGTGWNDGKGCAVGCTLEAYNHARYETELGIPEWLARVEDTLFEGMSRTKSKTWPEKFLQVIPVGVDLSTVQGKFLIVVLTRALTRFDNAKFPEVTKVVRHVIGLYSQPNAKLEDFRKAAYAAACAADAAAYAAARAAACAAYAADAAARAAARAARAADAAARAARAAGAADAARAADAAAYAAARAEYNYFADELLKLLKAVGKQGKA